jgi:hypothetical protein
METAVKLLEEKICRELNIPLEELRAATITIQNAKVSVKLAERKEEPNV